MSAFPTDAPRRRRRTAPRTHRCRKRPGRSAERRSSGAGARLPLVIRRVPGLWLLLALAPGALVAVHELAFLLTFGAGFDAAMANSGHDWHWTASASVVVALSAVLAALASLQLWRLQRTASELDGSPVGPAFPARARDHRLRLRAYLRLLLPLWASLALLVAGLFVVQENLERLAISAPPPGLSVLGSAAYPVTVPIVVLVTLAFSAVGALFRLGHSVLAERIARLLGDPRPGRPSALRRPPLVPIRSVRSLIGDNRAGRAPPDLVLA